MQFAVQAGMILLQESWSEKYGAGGTESRGAEVNGNDSEVIQGEMAGEPRGLAEGVGLSYSCFSSMCPQRGHLLHCLTQVGPRVDNL